MPTSTFVDTNVIIYLLSADEAKANRAEALLQNAAPGSLWVSVQVLNEIANVALRKLKLLWPEVNELLAVVQACCSVAPLNLATHTRGVQLAQRYRLSLYDAMIAAAALQAGCTTLHSEDLHHGLLVEGELRVCNPFFPQNDIG
jgi:predicted nucleic acid-binding protein